MTSEAYDLSRKSRPIVIVPHQQRWAEEYRRTADHLEQLAGQALLHVDHIGSTAVPGLAAKDIIDIQITIASFDRAEALLERLVPAGYRIRGGFRYDFFTGMTETDPGLRKLYLREPEGGRRTHLHVREQGRFNQRYALLFRDYLRASAESRRAYELLKRRLAEVFPDSIDGYLFLKDPAMQLIYDAACRWAELVAWQPGIPTRGDPAHPCEPSTQGAGEPQAK